MRRPRERLSSTDRLSRYTTRLSERLTILGCLVGLVLLTELGVLGVTGHALLPAAHDHGPNPGGEEMKPETLEACRNLSCSERHAALRCVLSDVGTARCMCKTISDCDARLKLAKPLVGGHAKARRRHVVCGSDGKTYPSKCHVEVASCSSGRQIFPVGESFHLSCRRLYKETKHRKVLSKPYIHDPPVERLLLKPGGKVTIKCAAICRPMSNLQITWLHNEQVLHSHSPPHGMQITSPGPGISRLHIDDLRPYNAGQYWCVAENLAHLPPLVSVRGTTIEVLKRESSKSRDIESEYKPRDEL